MKRLAFLALLGLATTSVAYAQPQHRHQRDQYDNDRWDRNGRNGGRWTTIARNYSAQTDKQSINMSGHGGYKRLRVESVRGAPVIIKVVIEYVGDPNAQAVELNSRMQPGQGETIRLNGNGKRINRIVVYTEPQYRGSYSIYGA